jgi:uncharacterized protein (DUF58 family)
MHLRSWGPFLLLVFVVGAIANSAVLVTLSVSLGIILGVTGWWQRHSLDGVTYQRKLRYRRGFPGEQVALRITVENHKLLPLSWLKVEDAWPRAVGPLDLTILAPSHILDQGFLTHAFSLRWFERTHRDYTLLFRERGYYALGPASLSSGDLFGMYEREGVSGSVERVTVFPRLLTRQELRLPTENPFGNKPTRRRVFEDPNRPRGARAYTPEDEFKRIHWPATARSGTLQVKEYEPVSGAVLMVCLNVVTFPHYWEGVYPALLEQLISLTATLIYYGMEDGYSVGLATNGALARSDRPFRAPPGRSARQLGHLLQALAEVTPFTTAPFERFLVKMSPEIPYGATLVLVTAWVTPELRETLMRLKRYRPHITLISLEQKAPLAIPGVRILHRPFEDSSG